jgi:DUF1680 family protein
MKNKLPESARKSGLQLHYDFSGVSSTIVPDVSDKGYTGVIRNYDGGGALILEEDIYGRPFKTILLPGGEEGGYLELPRGILDNKEGISISFWCKVMNHKESQILFSFGKDNMLYLKTLPGDSSNELPCLPCVSSGGQSQEQAVCYDKKVRAERWYHYCITLKTKLPSQFTFYLDGQLEGCLEQKRVDATCLSGEECCFLGKGIFGQEPANIQMADVRIYNRVLAKDEVRELFFVSEEDCLQADKEYLWKLFPIETTEDIFLPITGPYGSKFTYQSLQEEFLTSDGKVKQPLPGKTDEVVKLQIFISRDGIEKKTNRAITVKALPSKEMFLQQEAELLELPELNHIHKDIILPTRGQAGSTIRWSSSDPLLISTEGVVFRGQEKEGKKRVVLTAEFLYDGMERIKKFNAVILPEYKQKQVYRIPLIKIETESGIPPVLPNRIWIEYSDGTRTKEQVFWCQVSEGDFKKKGTLTIKGLLKEKPQFVIPAYITVRDGCIEKKKMVDSFALGEVSLSDDTILTQNNKRTLDYLKLLNPDRMLYAFRSTFSADTKNAKPLGGWDEPLGLLRGHSTGHFLSALALAYSSTKDAEIKNKLDYLIDSLKELQDLTGGEAGGFKTMCSKENPVQSMWGKLPSLWGKGYLSAYPPDQFALLEEFTTYPTIWAPYYTLHKILAGLLDCYEYARNRTALSIACGIGNWVYDRLSGCTAEQLNKMWSMYIAGEYGGMNESLAQLYSITKDEKYLKAAALFDNHKVFSGLAENKDTIASIHANQHIPQIIGALKEYEVTGEIKYYRTAYYFWHLVTKHYAYSIGGVGRGENFKEGDILAGHIEGDRNCETCAAYNMLKLTRELYLYEPQKSEYMDYYEKTLINHIVASQNPVVTEKMHHGVTYMLPIGPGQHKEYGTDYEEFTCCHGTGMENHVKYQEGIYFKDWAELKLYINLYMPSVMHWKEQEIVFTQSGGFPQEKMIVTVKSEKTFTCCFRIPDWCRNKFKMILNGIELERTEEGSGYISITRAWMESDRLEIHTPYELALEYTPDDLDLPVASVLYGPFVMVALNSSREWITLTLSPELHRDFTVTWKEGMPTLSYDCLLFIPMYAAHHGDYHTYFKINIPYVD